MIGDTDSFERNRRPQVNRVDKRRGGGRGLIFFHLKMRSDLGKSTILRPSNKDYTKSCGIWGIAVQRSEGAPGSQKRFCRHDSGCVFFFFFFFFFPLAHYSFLHSLGSCYVYLCHSPHAVLQFLLIKSFYLLLASDKILCWEGFLSGVRRVWVADKQRAQSCLVYSGRSPQGFNLSILRLQ